MLMGERYKMVTNEVKNYMRGLYGQPPGKVNEEVRKKIIGDEEPITVRPADLIEPQMEQVRKEIGHLAETEEELLLYALFPQVAKPFLEDRAAGKWKVDLNIAAANHEEHGSVFYAV